jgi:hypothetical protein
MSADYTPSPHSFVRWGFPLPLAGFAFVFCRFRVLPVWGVEKTRQLQARSIDLLLAGGLLRGMPAGEPAQQQIQRGAEPGGATLFAAWRVVRHW